MKKLNILLFTCAVVAIAQVPTDSILVSESTKTVVETETKEWRTIVFTAGDNGDVSVRAVYERVKRVDGKLASAEQLREVTIPWSQATNIAPALVLVREQFKLAMSTILTNGIAE